MSASRARKILLAAIVLSLLLHLILAGYIRWPFNQPSQQNEIVKVRRITIAHAVPHTPPPTPAPTPVPTPRATAAPTSKVVPPHVTTRTAKGPPVAHAVAPSSGPSVTTAATQAPTPAPAATAAALACMQHDITPAVTATPQPVDIPPDARASKASGVAAIQVQLDAQGHVTDTSVAKSSGSTALDAVATALAKGATYSPALVKCKPVAAAYTFTVKFSPW